MTHKIIAEPTGTALEGETSLYKVFYIADNAAGTPIVIASDLSQKWAERFVIAYNTQPDLLAALEGAHKKMPAIRRTDEQKALESQVVAAIAKAKP